MHGFESVACLNKLFTFTWHILFIYSIPFLFFLIAAVALVSFYVSLLSSAFVLNLWCCVCGNDDDITPNLYVYSVFGPYTEKHRNFCMDNG